MAKDGRGGAVEWAGRLLAPMIIVVTFVVSEVLDDANGDKDLGVYVASTGIGVAAALVMYATVALVARSR